MEEEKKRREEVGGKMRGKGWKRREEGDDIRKAEERET